MLASLGGVYSLNAAPLKTDDHQVVSGPQEETVSYFEHIRPILVQNCVGCHQPARPGGGLIATKPASLIAGGESGSPAIIRGDADGSTLMAYLTPLDGEAMMPKDKPPLSAGEIDVIRRWIAQGAKDDSPATGPTVNMQHPPVYELPPVLTSVSYSPNGDVLAVSGYHEVLLHALETSTGAGSTIVGRLVGLSERIETVAFSPDGTKLAVVGGSPARFGEVQVWEVAGQELLVSANFGFDTLYGASWSHDGKLIAFGCPDNTVRAIDAETGVQVFQQGAHTDWPLDTVFSTDDTHLISVGRDRTAKLAEVATQRFVDNITSITPGALKGGLISVDIRPGIAPKENQIVFAGADGAPKLYRIHRVKERVIGDDFNFIRAYDPLPGRVYVVRFNAEGKWFIAGSSYDDPPAHVRLGEVRVYETETGKQVSRVNEQLPAIYDAAFSPDGTSAAIVGFDGMVRIIDPTTGEITRTFSAAPLSSGDETTNSQSASTATSK
ncbi:MAG: hypothetical protein MPJ50_12800 [Pirellulales bacterium]|nr:hypothetical protein [Pirellulales bacterium]